MVFLQHCGLMPFGWMGVWVFYVISGYVVCKSFHKQMLREPEDPAGVVRHFMFRRATRIWPVYFLYVIVSALAFYLFTGVINWGELIALFGFVYNWEMIFDFAGPGVEWPGYGHLWTISVEQQFYLIFPLIYFLFIHHRATFRGALLILLLSPAIRFAMGFWAHEGGADDGLSAFLVYASTFGHVDAFLFGALLARHQDRILSWEGGEKNIWLAALSVSAVYCLAQILTKAVVLKRQGIAQMQDVVSGILYGQLQEVFVYYVPVFLGLAVIVSILKGSWFTRPLAWGPMVWIGQISYGAYVFHIAAIYVLTLIMPFENVRDLGIVGRFAFFLLAYGLTLGAAECSYRMFETRFSRLRMSVVR